MDRQGKEKATPSAGMERASAAPHGNDSAGLAICRAILEKALSGNPDEILRYFPGKSILSTLASKLGMTTDTHARMVLDALRSTPDSKLYSLGEKLSKNLEKTLPKRA